MIRRYSLASIAILALVALAPQSRAIAQPLTWLPTSLNAGGAITTIIVRGGTILVGVDTMGIYRSVNNGSTWAPANSGLSHRDVRALAMLPNGAIYAGTAGGGVFRSSNFGGSWLPAHTGLGDMNVQTMIPLGASMLLAGTNAGIYRFDAETTMWTLLGLQQERIMAIAADSAGTIIASTAAGPVYRSTDGGEHWTETSLSTGGVVAIAAHPSGIFYAASTTLSVSRDGGAVWEPAGFGAGTAEAIAIGRNGSVYVGSDQGVTISRDSGRTWKALGTGLEGRTISAIIVPDNGIVLAGDNSGRLYRSSISSGVGNDAVAGMTRRALGSAYPNPATGSASIPFALPRRSDVRLTIVDALGRTMGIIEPGRLDAGDHTLAVDLTALPGGLYLYRLQADGIDETRAIPVAR